MLKLCWEEKKKKRKSIWRELEEFEGRVSGSEARKFDIR